jgi:hypothetical protein
LSNSGKRKTMHRHRNRQKILRLKSKIIFELNELCAMRL